MNLVDGLEALDKIESDFNFDVITIQYVQSLIYSTLLNCKPSGIEHPLEINKFEAIASSLENAVEVIEFTQKQKNHKKLIAGVIVQAKDQLKELNEKYPTKSAKIMRELDVVYALKPCLADSGILVPKNSIGTLVHAYPQGLDFEVEFNELGGNELVLATRNVSQINLCSEWPVHIIHTKQQFILSKKPYGHWREIQSEYSEYIASVRPMNLAELQEYLEIEYKGHPPISKEDASEFVYSSVISVAT